MIWSEGSRDKSVMQIRENLSAHEKILLKMVLVPQTDTGVLAEKAKAFT